MPLGQPPLPFYNEPQPGAGGPGLEGRPHDYAGEGQLNDMPVAVFVAGTKREAILLSWIRGELNSFGLIELTQFDWIASIRPAELDSVE